MTDLQTIITRLQEMQAKLPEAPTTLKEFSKGQVVYTDWGHEYRVTSYDGDRLRLSGNNSTRLILYHMSKGRFRPKGHYGLGGDYYFYATQAESHANLKRKNIAHTVNMITKELDALDKRLS